MPNGMSIRPTDAKLHPQPRDSDPRPLWSEWLTRLADPGSRAETISHPGLSPFLTEPNSLLPTQWALNNYLLIH